MIKRIIECYESKRDYPYSVSEFFEILGYSRRDNAIRAITKNKKITVHDYCISDYKNFRYGEDIQLSRDLFFKLIEKSNRSIYFEYVSYRKEKLLEQLRAFKIYKKPEAPTKQNIYSKIQGEFYTYNLSSYNICRDLELNPIIALEIINENFHQDEYGSRWRLISECKNRKFSHFPSYNFNHTSHTKRIEAMTFINILKKRTDLNYIQSALIEVFCKGLDELLYKQANIDAYNFKKQREKLNKKKNKGNQTPPFDIEKMKKMYREAAFLCHPDKNPQGESLFKELNNANMRGDYIAVKKIYETLTNVASTSQ